MKIDLTGRRYIILAGSKGMGFATVKAISDSGGEVIFCSRSRSNVEEALKKLGKRDGIKGTTCDLTDEDSLNSFFDSLSSIAPFDGMVYNSGGPPPGPFTEIDLKKWDYTYRLLVRSAVIATKRFVELGREGASVVYIASIAVKEPVENLVLSNSLRMSILGLSKTLSREMGKRFRFNVVLPGYILTDRIKELVHKRSLEQGVPETSILEEMASEVPMGRLGKPEEVGSLVLFLLSPHSSYINGAVIPIDGGLHRSSI